MCGIAGLIDPSRAVAAREQAVQRMCNAMIHRGPDDAGMASRGPATIGMRRLAIFDPANGHQPMVTADGRYTLIFNGAIYNFRILQGELESAGIRFHTQCDTEILLAALAHWGQKALGRLRGMYAFALWDSTDESLLIARDPFGIKPLYYSHAGECLVFASEVGAIRAAGVVDSPVDPLAVADYLAWLAVPAPRTIFGGILSLKPGHCIHFQNGVLQIRPTWSFSAIDNRRDPCKTRPEFIAQLRERLNDSIRAHVLADVPVGAFLSGGLDSAVIAGLMSQLSGNALKTFTIAFEENNFSEADEAQETARHFGAVHHTRILTGDEVARDINKFIDACDQPTGDGVNTYYASQTAREGGVKVALSGLGGDELFGGYPSFKTVRSLSSQLPRWQSLPESLRSLVLKSMNLGGTRARKLADFLKHARSPHELASLSRRVFSEASRNSILSPEMAALVEGTSPFHPALESMQEDVGAADLFSLVSSWELRTYMADVLLRDSDVMSMRNAIELRVPFIDRPLIEWLWNQPSHFKDDRKNPKSPLVEATIDILPKGLQGRRKRGFTLPFPNWMRKELKPFLEETFSSGSIGRSGFFSTPAIQGLWVDFVNGGENREWSRLWSLAVLIAFMNRRAATGRS
jgi:asparagine synthase (glutamine-hydrolysing)